MASVDRTSGGPGQGLVFALVLIALLSVAVLISGPMGRTRRQRRVLQARLSGVTYIAGIDSRLRPVYHRAWSKRAPWQH